MKRHYPVDIKKYYKSKRRSMQILYRGHLNIILSHLNLFAWQDKQNHLRQIARTDNLAFPLILHGKGSRKQWWSLTTKKWLKAPCSVLAFNILNPNLNKMSIVAHTKDLRHNHLYNHDNDYLLYKRNFDFIYFPFQKLIFIKKWKWGALIK